MKIDIFSITVYGKDPKNSMEYEHVFSFFNSKNLLWKLSLFRSILPVSKSKGVFAA